MIVKVAEKEVCRLGEGVSGLYIEEEMPDEYSLENTLNYKKKEIKIKNNKINDDLPTEVIETKIKEVD